MLSASYWNPTPDVAMSETLGTYQLAQANVARRRYPLEDPRMQGFTGRLEEINALAESSPGFVWRFEDASGNATATRVLDNPELIFNMSVWESLDALKAFAYGSTHRELLRGRQDWFHPEGAQLVLWWVEAGHRPTVAEGEERLRHIQAHGPSATAFHFGRLFAPPGSAANQGLRRLAR